MKTKTLLYILMSVLVLSFASCTDDDKIDYIKHDELPKEVQTFLSEYLPNNKFVSATTNDISGEAYYMVQLKDDVQAILTKDNWVNLTSEKGLPETVINLLSRESRKQFNEQHGAAKITGLNKYTNSELGIRISLDNYKMLNDMYGHEGDVLGEILSNEAFSALPDKLKLFFKDILNINTRASDERPWHHMVKFSGFKGTIYRYRITPDAFVDFYEDGEWFYMKESGSTRGVFENVLLKAIPKEIVAALVKKEPNAIASIQKITRFDDNKVYGFNKLYGFDFGDNQFILINSENQIVEPPLDKAKEFINRGFNPKNELQYKINANITGPYFLRYAFKVTGSTEDITLVMDVNGNMRSISAGPITTEAGKTVALPRAVLEMLHEDIVSYIDINFPDGKPIRISYAYSKIGDLPNKVSLMMSIPMNLRTLVFDSNTGEFIEEYYAISITN